MQRIFFFFSWVFVLADYNHTLIEGFVIDDASCDDGCLLLILKVEVEESPYGKL